MTATKSNREIFLAHLMRERDKFELLLNRVGSTRRMTLKGVTGKWSVKDVIAHIWAYEQYIADRMNEIAHHETYTPCKTDNSLNAFRDEFGYPDFGSPLLTEDEANVWVQERYKNVSLEEIVVQELQAFHSILVVLESLPDELIKRHNLLERVAENTSHHYREYARDIRAWLKAGAVNSKKS